jgi:hypothetical protein
VRRQLNTAQRRVEKIGADTAQPFIRRAFLTHAFPGSAGQGSIRIVMVSFNDPTTGARGTVVRARAQAGLASSTLPAGTPVTVVIRHGQVEIMSVG